MKRLFFLAGMALVGAGSLQAQSYKETFDSNSLEWTECASESSNGSAIIDQGVMTVESKGVKKGLSVLATVMAGTTVQVGENTFFETHAYVPLDVMKPFRVITHVNIGKLSSDRVAGFVFNYKDGGNFYCFIFDDEMVRFCRYVDNAMVGGISQSVKWADKKKVDQEWILESDGDQLTFTVDGMPIMKVRYMPLSYSGMGFYTFGKQKLIVDDIEFVQL